MPRLTQAVPKYRLHRASGQAVVTLSGRDHYLGPWKSKASRVEYDRLVGEWLARDRSPPPAPEQEITVVELIARFWTFAEGYYVKKGQPTGELNNFRHALRPLRELYGSTSAVEFGPLALKTVRAKMLERDLSRGVINGRIRKIKRVFNWGVAEELIPPAIADALAKVEGLKKGRSEARETAKVKPVADDVFEATVPHLPPVVVDMARFHRLVGGRPEEICLIRPCDVDRTEKVWSYRLEEHKTAHLDHEKEILIGPRAQAILAPYLNRDPQAFCFSPLESRHLREAAMRAKRKSKVQPSQVCRCKKSPRRMAGERYTEDSYRTAVHRACDKAFGAAAVGPLTSLQLLGMQQHGRLTPQDMIRKGERNRWKRASSERELFAPSTTFSSNLATWYFMPAISRWSPNQLRHSAATELRKKFGAEAARLVLGHRKLSTTEIYAERDRGKAVEIIAEVG